jgi:hypothetical protein
LPLEEMVPSEDEPPLVPLTAHATAVFELPDTVAVNWKESPARMFAEVGETLTETEAGVEGEELLGEEDVEAPPPQPTRSRAAGISSALAVERIVSLRIN